MTEDHHRPGDDQLEDPGNRPTRSRRRRDQRKKDERQHREIEGDYRLIDLPMPVPPLVGFMLASGALVLRVIDGGLGATEKRKGRREV